MKVAPFRLIPDRELRRLEDSLAPKVSDWCSRWLDVDGGVGLVAVTRSDDWNGAKGELWGAAGDEPCLLELPAAVRRKWVAMMLRSNRTLDLETELTAGLWSGAAADLMGVVTGAVRGRTESIRPELSRRAAVAAEWCRPGSGIVNVRLNGELGPINVLVPMPGAERSGTREARIDPSKRGALLRAALTSQSLSAEMILASEELALGELMNLRIGDVIALEQKCDEPVTLRFKDTDVIVNGFLGQLRGAKAFIAIPDKSTPKTHEK